MTSQPYTAPQARTPYEIDVHELQRRLNGGEKPLVVDVREAKELAICSLPGATHLPLSQFERLWQAALSGRENDELIVMCHHGVRSARVCGFLLQAGFTRPRSLVGGIDAWSLAIRRSRVIDWSLAAWARCCPACIPGRLRAASKRACCRTAR
ncbi:MAG: hypothetical protein L6Q71_05200 [Planctomycetes bacterium]|nr:hypothetical protein [Planctomycetota bacterium]NUQ35225.1 hypothetical protein [Planctomycetaceae bacterium]